MPATMTRLGHRFDNNAGVENALDFSQFLYGCRPGVHGEIISVVSKFGRTGQGMDIGHAQNNKQVRYAEVPHIGYGVTAAISQCSCVGTPRLLRNQRWKLSI